VSVKSNAWCCHQLCNPNTVIEAFLYLDTGAASVNTRAVDFHMMRMPRRIYNVVGGHNGYYHRGAFLVDGLRDDWRLVGGLRG
jgi:hypothetical protein